VVPDLDLVVVTATERDLRDPRDFGVRDGTLKVLLDAIVREVAG
jgi:hypothetical protein